MQHVSFASRLENISLSIDIVDDPTYFDIQNKIESYLYKLGIKFFEFLIPQTVDSEMGLTTVWHNGAENWSQKIKNSQGGYQGQISYAFDKQVSLCVISASGGKLSQVNIRYKNLWGGRGEILSDIPDYIGLINQDIFASIMIPLKDSEGRAVGIFNFEFSETFEYTIRLQHELLKVANAFKTIYLLNKFNKTQKSNSNEAINSLANLDSFNINFKKPKVFFASANKADRRVVNCIESVLAHYGNRVHIEYWWDVEGTGSITEKLLKSISECSFGICYLSEKVEGSTMQFKDNPNVLFEAGMLHGLSRTSAQAPKNWVPIREAEKYSGPIPFDLRTEYAIIVPRSELNMDLDENRLKNSLKVVMEALFPEA